MQEERLLDVNLIQPAHGGPETLVNGVKQIQREYAHEPAIPSLIAEMSYEGILHYSGPEVQRFGFWIDVLSGGAGHTYGANGLWQFNTRDQPYGASPWGGTWGNLPWDECARLPGSAQLGMAARFMQRFSGGGSSPTRIGSARPARPSTSSCRLPPASRAKCA